jgi:predicted phosphodiesterase
MRILIVSDLHANPDALAVLPDADATLCAGDLVDFGPDPVATITWCRRRNAIVAMGNHDLALSSGADCGVTGIMREASTQTRRAHARMLSSEDYVYLRSLPRVVTASFADTAFAITHAVPNDVYRYTTLPVAGSLLFESVPNADVLILGHTHIQQCIADVRTMVNPGSVGVASAGGMVHYALWVNGKLSLHATPYDVEATIAKVQRLDLDALAFEPLAHALRHGRTRRLDELK